MLRSHVAYVNIPAMAGQVYDIKVNRETTREDLERCIGEAEHTSNVGVQNVAAQAKAEIARRERDEERRSWLDRLNAESQERAKAQKFQEAQNTRLIEAQENSMGKQTKVAEASATAAKWSAIATIGLLVVTALMAVVSLLAYWRE